MPEIHELITAREQGKADSDAGRPSRFAEFAGAARSAYIVGFSDATRARWAK